MGKFGNTPNFDSVCSQRNSGIRNDENNLGKSG